MCKYFYQITQQSVETLMKRGLIKVNDSDEGNETDKNINFQNFNELK